MISPGQRQPQSRWASLRCFRCLTEDSPIDRRPSTSELMVSPSNGLRSRFSRFMNPFKHRRVDGTPISTTAGSLGLTPPSGQEYEHTEDDDKECVRCLGADDTEMSMRELCSDSDLSDKLSTTAGATEPLTTPNSGMDSGCPPSQCSSFQVCDGKTQVTEAPGCHQSCGKAARGLEKMTIPGVKGRERRECSPSEERRKPDAMNQDELGRRRAGTESTLSSTLPLGDTQKGNTIVMDATQNLAEIAIPLQELGKAQEGLLSQFYDRLGIDKSQRPQAEKTNSEASSSASEILEQLSTIYQHQRDFLCLMNHVAEQDGMSDSVQESNLQADSRRSRYTIDSADSQAMANTSEFDASLASDASDECLVLVPRTVASMEPEETLLFQIEQELHRHAQQEVSFIVPPDCPPGTDVRFTHNRCTYKVTIGPDHLPGTQVHVRVGKPPPLSPRARKEVHDFVRVGGEPLQVHADLSMEDDLSTYDLLQNVTSQRRLHAYRSLQGQNMRPLLPDVEEDGESQGLDVSYSSVGVPEGCERESTVPSTIGGAMENSVPGEKRILASPSPPSSPSTLDSRRAQNGSDAPPTSSSKEPVAETLAPPCETTIEEVAVPPSLEIPLTCRATGEEKNAPATQDIIAQDVPAECETSAKKEKGFQENCRIPCIARLPTPSVRRSSGHSSGPSVPRPRRRSPTSSSPSSSVCSEEYFTVCNPPLPTRESMQRRRSNDTASLPSSHDLASLAPSQDAASIAPSHDTASVAPSHDAASLEPLPDATSHPRVRDNVPATGSSGDADPVARQRRISSDHWESCDSHRSCTNGRSSCASRPLASHLPASEWDSCEAYDPVTLSPREFSRCELTSTCPQRREKRTAEDLGSLVDCCEG